MHYHRSFGKSILFVAILFGLVLGVFIGGFAESYASNVPEKLSSYDHVEESRISLTGNSVFIDTNYDLRWSKFEDTNSMNPLIDKGHNGLEFIPTDVNDIHLGDVISFGYGDEVYIHRVVEIGKDEFGIYFVTKGDNNFNIDDGVRRFEDIQGVLFGVVF
ncbi:hypothetical protein HOM13_01305 [Candidatus Woesearchaeota archaeon]|jgi:hypothetical protein|nr:hypothetical protein [Candidatus Woesearchaeota archaeon]MBT5215352.1 hypothetical protein [Candidatus Woesearchaeota archaeon]MBT6402101.1 hypothetical protein [Candidatus Woesearchaeota archaeon]